METDSRQSMGCLRFLAGGYDRHFCEHASPPAAYPNPDFGRINRAMPSIRPPTGCGGTGFSFPTSPGKMAGQRLGPTTG